MFEPMNLHGKKFGRWTVLDFAGIENHKSKWLCECECGTKRIVRQTNLIQGISKSCGCYKRDRTAESHTTHGKRHTRLYNIYHGMKARCYNENEAKYEIYGARGITICDEWLNKEHGFENFYEWAINNGYSDDLSIDRIYVNGNYEPSNCRWATAKEQALNTRFNRRVFADGKEMTLEEFANYVGINKATIYKRLKRGITFEQMVENKGKRIVLPSA